jgi:pimeloyl-ACP methyl ester carboxylesterase
MVVSILITVITVSFFSRFSSSATPQLEWPSEATDRQPDEAAVLKYRQFGQDDHKPYLVFIHGAGSSSTIFHKQVRALRVHFNLLLVDLRGHGLSQPSIQNHPYTFEGLTRDVLDLLDHLNIQQAHFMGVSLGTILIRYLTTFRPHLVQSCVLAGAILHINAPTRVLVNMGRLLKHVLPYMWLYRLFSYVILPNDNHKEARDLFIHEAKKLNQSEFKRWFTLAHRVNPTVHAFNQQPLTRPTLYIMGEEDYLFLPHVKKQINLDLASQLTVLPKAGHICNIDAPDAFNAASITFFLANPPLETLTHETNESTTH